jgi:putative ABC transport system permease protein
MWRKSVADIVRRRTQSILIIAAILVPVAGLTAVGVAASTLSAAYRFTLEASGSKQDVAVALDRSDVGLSRDVAENPNVVGTQLAVRLDTQWHVATAPGHVDLQITGYPDPAHAPLTPLSLVAGRYPGPGEVVMDYADRALGTAAIGTDITIDAATGFSSLRVVGEARSAGQNPATTGEATAYMSSAALDRIPAFAYSPTATTREPIETEQLSLYLHDPTAYADIVRALGPTFATNHATVLAVFPPDKNAPVRQVNGILTLARALLAIAVVLSALLVLSAVAALVAEQTATIATLKTLGATRYRILRHYWLTVTALSLVATPAGLVIGILAGGQLAGRMAASIPLAVGSKQIPATTLALGGLVGLGIPVLAALMPIRKATRVTVREALTGGITSVQPTSTPRRFVAPVRQTVQLGVRGLARKPWRAGLSIVTLAVAAMSFFVVQTLTSSVQQSIQGVWGSFHADVEVYVGADHSLGQVNQLLGRIPNIARVERVGWYGSQTQWGKLGVWGLEPQSTLYSARITSGHWLTAGDPHGCLISTDLATRAHLRVGSSLDVPGSGGARATRFTVVGVVDQPVDDLSQVGTVDMPVDSLYQLEGAPDANINDYTNRVLIQARDRSAGAVDALTRAIDQTGRTSSADRNGPVTEVFRFRDEVIRHQRNFLPIRALLLAASILVAFVGLLGLADALSAAVTDQRNDIGLLRALGATGRDVATVVWAQALAVSLAAWALAAAIGIPLARLAVEAFRRQVMPTDYHLDALNLLVMVAITAAVASGAALLPARRAASLKPTELLRRQ